jgi:PAS domain S-box-containing protein
MTDIITRPRPRSAPGFVIREPPQADSSEDFFRKILDALPAAIYTTDAAGRITYFNEAAAALWGHRPQIGTSEWCGSWKLFWPDGRPLPHGECPMAIAIKEQRIVRGMEAIAERPDGTRVPFDPYPTPLFDASGELVGAINMLVDLTARKEVEETKLRLAQIVQFSDDAIISKSINGIIQSWNAGAERIFGYTASEAIGQSVEMLIPLDRRNEEPEILNRIRGGERIDHYETVRRRRDGSLIDVSLSVSPIMDADGRIIGASKIARDITERRRAEEQRELLFREMDHRIRNLFALAESVISLSVQSAATPKQLASIARDRLQALSRAHALTLPKRLNILDQTKRPTTLQALIRTIVSPYDEADGTSRRVAISGSDVDVSPALATDLALLLHEFATNAAKYGALSTPTGRINIVCSETDDLITLDWTESGGPRIEKVPTEQGFGSKLAQATVVGRLGGKLAQCWNPDGLTIRLSVDPERLKS